MKALRAGCVAIVAAAASLNAQTASAPDMLERTMPGLLTIAVNETLPVSSPLGAASSTRLEKAYERVLDLSDAKGTGSGFLIMRGGKPYVVTNVHVIANAAKPDEIYAYSFNQTKYRLRVFGGDSFYDIALLEFVEPAAPGPELTPLRFRETDTRVGEAVYALGNPLSEYPNSVSSGIIGGKNRFLSGPTGRIGYLQHTATIIWGNSGGPLIDSSGRVVGINTRIEIKEIVHPQLNFALDGVIANRLVDQLIAGKGRLVRAYLGLELAQSIETAKFRKMVTADAVVESVVPGGPSAALAKYIGARVDRIGTHPVRNLDEAMAAIEELKPGQTVEFELSKDGVTSTATILTASLTDDVKGRLASHILRSHLNVEIANTADGVVLRPLRPSVRTPATAPRKPMTQYEPLGKKASIQPGGSAPEEVVVLAVGLVPENRNDKDAEPLLYRVQQLGDLETSLRLLLMLGRVDFVVGARGWDEPRVSRWVPSGAPNVVKRMFIC